MKQQVFARRGRRMNVLTAVALAFCGASVFTACSQDTQAMTADQIEQQYGVAGAYAGSVDTSDGPVKGTLVPITLPNGRQGQLFIPVKKTSDPNTVYVRDEKGLHPVQLKDEVSRDEVVRAPAIVVEKPAIQRAKKRSWEKEALIIGGSAGGGAAIGAVSGGKKGAGIGAAAGGVGGLIYDLMTRDKK